MILDYYGSAAENLQNRNIALEGQIIHFEDCRFESLSGNLFQQKEYFAMNMCEKILGLANIETALAIHESAMLINWMILVAYII